jgi:hypothetical protein
MKNKPGDGIADDMEALPDNSISDITFFGRGNMDAIEVIYGDDALARAERGGDVYLGSDKFADLVKPKLILNASINLDGCNTARWDMSIASEVSRLVPNAVVRGCRGFGITNLNFGGTWRFCFTKTYKNGRRVE